MDTLSKIGTVIGWLLCFAMFGLTCTRTYSFISLLVPLDQWYVPWLGLGAFDLALPVWLIHFIGVAKSGWAKAVAGILLGICACGIGVTVIGDAFLNNHSTISQAVVAVVWGIVLASEYGWLGFHMIQLNHVRNQLENREINLISGVNQVDSDEIKLIDTEAQLEKFHRHAEARRQRRNQVEKAPYTHNGPASNKWGGGRPGAGRPEGGEEQS